MNKKRDSNTQSLKDALKRYTNHYRLDSKLSEVKLISSWEQEMGKMISNHTKKIYVKNKVLFVHLDSSIVRNELSYAKEKIVTRLNAKVGARVIDKIILT